MARLVEMPHRIAYTDVHDPRLLEHAALGKAQKAADNAVDEAARTARTMRAVTAGGGGGGGDGGDGGGVGGAQLYSPRSSRGVRYTDIHGPKVYLQSAMGVDALKEYLVSVKGPSALVPSGASGKIEMPFPMPNTMGLPTYAKRQAEEAYASAIHHAVPVDVFKPSPMQSTRTRVDANTLVRLGDYGEGGGHGASAGTWTTATATTTRGFRDHHPSSAAERGRGGRAGVEPKTYGAVIEALKAAVAAAAAEA